MHTARPRNSVESDKVHWRGKQANSFLGMAFLCLCMNMWTSLFFAFDFRGDPPGDSLELRVRDPPGRQKTETSKTGANVGCYKGLDGATGTVHSQNDKGGKYPRGNRSLLVQTGQKGNTARDTKGYCAHLTQMLY